MIIAVSNLKGGSAKTTTSIHLGAGLAKLGKKVLLVDMDPQGHVAEGLGLASFEIEHDISAVLTNKRRLSDIVYECDTNLDLAPANIQLAIAENGLHTRPRKEDRLKNALATVKGKYDYIVIDCQPSLGLFPDNAFSAADYVLIPMVAEPYAMYAVEYLLKTIEDRQKELAPQLKVLGILPTRMTHTNNAREVLEHIQEKLGETIHIYTEPIPETVKFREAAGLGKTIYDYAPDSPGAVAYLNLCKEVIIDAK